MNCLIDHYSEQAGRCWDCDSGGKGEFCTNQKKAQGFVRTPVNKLQVRLSLRKARGSSQSHSVTHGAGMSSLFCTKVEQGIVTNFPLPGPDERCGDASFSDRSARGHQEGSGKRSPRQL